MHTNKDTHTHTVQCKLDTTVVSSVHTHTNYTFAVNRWSSLMSQLHSAPSHHFLFHVFILVSVYRAQKAKGQGLNTWKQSTDDTGNVARLSRRCQSASHRVWRDSRGSGCSSHFLSRLERIRRLKINWLTDHVTFFSQVNLGISNNPCALNPNPY